MTDVKTSFLLPIRSLASFGMTFSLSFRGSVSDERSFAHAQDDKKRRAWDDAIL